MTIEIRTPEEKAYDDLMSGAVYVKPQPPIAPANPSPLLISLIDWIDDEMEREAANLTGGTDVTDEMITTLESIERRYDALADQFAAVIRDPSLSPEQIGQRCAELAIAATPKSREWPRYEPFGQLSDGTPIDGHTDENESTGRCGVVSVEIGEFRLTAQDTPNLIGIQGDGYFIDELPIERLYALRDLLNTPFFDELLASAVAYGRGDAAPPVFAQPTPQIEIRHAYHNRAEDDDENPLTEAEEAAYDAANHQKVFDQIAAVMDGNAHTLFSDTIAGQINGTPIDLVIAFGIGAAIERNLTTLGITRDQLFQILSIAVNPIVDQYLMTPARRMQLLWQGE